MYTNINLFACTSYCSCYLVLTFMNNSDELAKYNLTKATLCFELLIEGTFYFLICHRYAFFLAFFSNDKNKQKKQKQKQKQIHLF